MTLQAQGRKSVRVQPVLTSFYAQWRVRCGVAPLLREDCESPPEYLLQSIWQHQRLLRDQLKTLDGQPVRVLHPGFRSVEGGPDFRDAMVQVGERSPQVGDVEVDLRSSGWHAHGHDRNPAFRKVILHVIWESERAAAGAPPVLRLSGSLDAPLGELSLWLGSEAAQELPEHLRGRCCSALRGLGTRELVELLHQAAQVRLRSKAARFQGRARQAGWEQALWEGLFNALGYKHNIWPMQRLAELRERWGAQASERGPAPRVEGSGPGDQVSDTRQFSTATPLSAAEVFKLQARLLGLSGLLPADLTRSQAATDGYLRRVWDEWWRERDVYSDCVLPRTLWRFHGLRPANHPQRRLALASHWVGGGDLVSRIEQWCQRAMPAVALAGSLLETLQVESDDFWSWHWTFRSARLKRPQPLLGAMRGTDLAINVILPWLWIRAVEGKNEAIRKDLEERYYSWPAAEDNSLLRFARQRLLGGAGRGVFRDAAAQQGLIQIHRDFCEHSNALCENCKLPELVKEFGANRTTG